MNGSAVIDPTGRYRYVLRRTWDTLGLSKSRILWVMLNPSTADASVNDRTISKCIKYSQAWGFGGLEVVNLFAYRATDPKELQRVADPVGPENDDHIRREASAALRVMCAWGVNGALYHRDMSVLGLLTAMGIGLYVLDLTGGGMPCHPLYLKGDLKPLAWKYCP